MLKEFSGALWDMTLVTPATFSKLLTHTLTNLSAVSAVEKWQMLK